MFEDSIFETIKKYNMIRSGDLIVLAVSGGPDSMCMLDVLKSLREKLNFQIVVAHVNHMIRSVADSETKYVERYCDKNGIDCYIKKVDVIKLAESQKISTEEAGRNTRYEFFEEVYNKVGATKIAIAHNKNDNVETVLMNIIRGTGTAGLKGIEPIRDNKFIRPLIETDRQDIEKYCESKNLQPKIDESNFENIYTRNKIRNLLIPYLKKEFNPSIVDSITRLSNLAMQENKYIEMTVQAAYKNIVKQEQEFKIVLDLKLFNGQDDFVKSKIILLGVQKIFGTTKGIEKIHIEDIIKLCKNNIGNKYLTPNKNTKIEVSKGEIIISKI